MRARSRVLRTGRGLSAECSRVSPRRSRALPSDVTVEPRWIPLDTLISINAYACAQTGEPHALRDAGLLESAWAKPQNRWAYEGEADLLRLAVALMAGVAQNHPFQQGNKRTAFAGGLSFLDQNGYDLDEALDSAAFADAFVELIEHKVDEGAFAERMRPHVVPRG